jgi:hypothetical protein
MNSATFVRVAAWLGLTFAGHLAARAQAANRQPIIQADRNGDLMLHYVPESSRPAPTILSTDNISMLVQVGYGNQATTTQNGDANAARLAVVGNASTTLVTQQGNHNSLDATLRGSNNLLDARQTGNGNEYDLDLTGSNNPVRLVQTGNSNHVDSNLTGNNRQYSISQFGNNNELSQREGTNTLLPTGYKVEMTGNGIRMTIEQGKLP